jgi:hypothetical protein
MLEQTLNRMAETILHLDEASLVALWDKYRRRVEQVEVSRDWERSVIVYFMINAVRAKNQALNEKILADGKQPSRQEPPASSAPPARKRHPPPLTLVKTSPQRKTES